MAQSALVQVRHQVLLLRDNRLMAVVLAVVVAAFKVAKQLLVQM
jgi:hypothetical protein